MKIRIAFDAREVAELEQLLEALHRILPGCRVKRQADAGKTVVFVTRKMTDGGLRGN